MNERDNHPSISFSVWLINHRINIMHPQNDIEIKLEYALEPLESINE